MSEPWSIEDDIRLFRWITEFKPAGMHKHFHMINILERMNKPELFPVVLLFDKQKSESKGLFTREELWAKLSKHYDLDMLDKVEDDHTGREAGEATSVLPLSLRRVTKQQREFHLPWDEYGELILENAQGAMEEEHEEFENPEQSEISKERGETAESEELQGDTTQKEEEAAEENMVADEKEHDEEPEPKPQDEELSERVPRRVTRSAAVAKPAGRITRSHGPADQASGVDGHESAPSEEPTNGETPVTGEEKEEDSAMGDLDGEKDKDKDESAQGAETPAEGEPAEAEEPEQPPSKRTRTTRSQPREAPAPAPASTAPAAGSASESRSTRLGGAKESVSPPSETEPAEDAEQAAKAPPAKRSSSRVANRRKARR